MVMLARPQCPECETVMIALARRPLLRIFGDIRAWQCPACDYMLLSTYPFRPASPEPAIVLRQDAAE
jgi:hypothetical protein